MINNCIRNQFLNGHLSTIIINLEVGTSIKNKNVMMHFRYLLIAVSKIYYKSYITYFSTYFYGYKPILPYVYRIETKEKENFNCITSTKYLKMLSSL